MSAYAGFPYIWAGVQAIATDLSGRPLVVVRTDASGNKELDKTHPLIERLKQPAPGVSGVWMRRQLYADLVLTGNAYIWRRQVVGGEIYLRIHPAEIGPVVRNGIIIGYSSGPDMGGDEKPKWTAQEILHIADIGWEQGARCYLGESVIRPLNDGLEAIRSARRQVERAARRGRLEFLVRPAASAGPMSAFSKEKAEDVKDAFVTSQERGDGVMVLNRALDVTPLSYSPRELEFSELHDEVREEQGSALGVPPVRMGRETANYGTAKQQMRLYWERLIGLSRLIDAALSRLLDDPALTIEHYFGDVEALQTARTERQMRASVWVTGFHADPAKAAAYEGFHDAPIPLDQDPESVSAPRRPAQEVDEPQAASMPTAETYLRAAGQRFQGYVTDGSIDDDTLVHIEAGMLAASLHVPLGVARDAASIMVHAVRGYCVERNGDAVLGVSTLQVFRPAFARHLRQLAAQEAA